MPRIRGTVTGRSVTAGPPFPASIAWLFLLALALPGLAWLRIDPVTFDSAVYFEMAQAIRAGRWSEALASPYPPLYPLLIAGLQYLGLSGEAAGVSITLAADLLLMFPLVAITRVAAGEAAARAAAFLWAIHPLAIRLGVQALTDAPTGLFVALALWAGLRALEGRQSWLLGAGVASGLAYLLRPEGIEPALALAILHGRLGGRETVRDDTAAAPHTLRRRAWTDGRGVRRRVMRVAAPLAGWALVASPYIASISIETGSLTLSKKKSVPAMVLALTPVPDGRRQRAREDGRGVQGTGRDLPHEAPVPQGGPGPQSMGRAGGPPSVTSRGVSRPWLARTARNAYTFQKPLVNGIHPLILVFALLAMWRIRSHGAEGLGSARALLAGLLGLHLAVLLALAAQYGAGYLGGHHFFLMVLYALPFAGAGFMWTIEWCRCRPRIPRWTPAALIGLLVVATGVWAATPHPGRGMGVRPAAAWIRSQVAGTPVIVTNIAKLTYHAGAERVELSGSYDEIIRRGRARAAQFVVFYPDLLPLVSRDFPFRLNPADLELARTFPEPSRSAPDQRLEVYRLHPGQPPVASHSVHGPDRRGGRGSARESD